MTHRSETSEAMAGGLTIFAAVMLIIAGIFGVFRGIMAIAEDDIFVNAPNYIFKFDVTGWGWIHLIVGVVAILVGLSLFKAALWARIAGVVIAALFMIVNFLSLPYYPFWSMILIAMDGFIIWALCVVRQKDLA
ncbi:hypothetical protein AB0D04_42420 [Streptomyces sp. NPDC048483]|uniref:DUF7144 family membrane protein n=1 Tax=Streptomyces sp. NPDC048483 TaxID=3154927 RepID=UPI0034356164